MEQKTKELNVIIVLLLILSIIRSIIRVFTAIVAMQIYSDMFVILEIILSIFVIAASIGILFKNKYALIALFVLGACIAIIAFCSGNTDTGFVQLAIMGLWALLFCLKKNGQSAWKTILFDNNKDIVNNSEDKTHIDTISTDAPTQPITIERQVMTQENFIVESNQNNTNQKEDIETVINNYNIEKDTDQSLNDFKISSKKKTQSLHKRVPKKMLITTIVSVLLLIIGLLSYWAWGNNTKTPEARYEEARSLYKENKTDDAIQILTELANDDYVKAKTALGYIHLFSKKIDLDSQKGFDYLKDAAKKDTNAIKLLIKIYNGKKCKGKTYSDDNELKKYLELAIKEKCSIGRAFFRLGELYARQEKYTNAYYNWQKATEYNEPLAYRNIGILFYHGWGCPVNYEKAKEYLFIAYDKDSNDDMTLLYLGMMYKYGLALPMDLEMAKDYLKRSADKGNEFAQQQYAEIEMSN